MEKKKFETGLTPEEEEILVGLRKKGRRTLIVNYILQGVTLLTAAACAHDPVGKLAGATRGHAARSLL